MISRLTAAPGRHDCPLQIWLIPKLTPASGATALGSVLVIYLLALIFADEWATDLSALIRFEALRLCRFA